MLYSGGLLTPTSSKDLLPRPWALRRQRPLGLLAVLFSVLVGQGFSLAASFVDPQIPDREYSTGLGYDKGKVVPIERLITHDNGCYRVEHTDSTGLRLVTRIDRKTMRTIRVEKFRHGQPTLTETFDSTGVLVVDERTKKTRRFRYRGMLYDRHTLSEVFRGFPFDRQQSVEFPLCVPEWGIITAVVSFDKKEIIETDIGRSECYKMTMRPKGVAGWLYTKRFYFWYETGPRHRLLFYSDSDGRMTKIKSISTAVAHG